MNYFIVLIIFSFLLAGCNKINDSVFSGTEPTNNNLSSANPTPEVPPLRIYWQGQSYIATKGIYTGEDVELLGKTEDDLQIYRRKNQSDLNSLLLKNPRGGYLIIYQLEKK